MSLKVSDVMTRRTTTVLPDAPVLEAMRLMLEERISGVPVADTQGALAGIVTEGDFLRRAELDTERQHPRWLAFLLGPGRLASEYVGTHGRKVSEVMTRNVITVPVDAPLTEAVRLMEVHNIKRLPVIENGKLAGILSRADLLRAVLAAAAKTEPADGSDAAIRAQVINEIERQGWSPKSMITVGVDCGIVNLRGVLFDDRLREALRVLIENVPGVKQINDYLVTIEPMTGFIVQAPA